MKTAALITLLVLAVSAPRQALAQRVSTIDGNRLLTLCTGKNVSGCDAYVSGFADSEYSISPLRVCVPLAVTCTALRETLVAFLRANPAALPHKAADITLRALTRAYPCGK